MDDPNARNVWPVLGIKARRKASLCARVLQQAQARSDRAETSLQRVRDMLEDYQRRQRRDQLQPRSLADSRNDRLFIEQLQTLLEKVQAEALRAAAERDAARQTWVLAEQEVLKAGKLEERAEAKNRAELERREQARLNEWGTMRHAWKQTGAAGAAGTAGGASATAEAPPSSAA